MDVRYRPLFKGLIALRLILCMITSRCYCLDDASLPPNLFYPFGTDVGDQVVPREDDGVAGPISLTAAFPFHNESYGHIYVGNNGYISFRQVIDWYTPIQLPITGTRYAMLDVYWADSDVTVNSGCTYYREVTQTSSSGDLLLNRATQDVRQYFTDLASFKARWLFISTWHNETYSGGDSTSPVNTFQAVLISDFKRSVVLYSYGKLTWTTGSSSGGTNGLSGVAALVGYNSGYSNFYYQVPLSMSSRILELVNASNVDYPGRLAFKVGDITNFLQCNSDDTAICQLVYQEMNSQTGACVDVAPVFSCPLLEGPTVIDRLRYEFYCTVNTTVTDSTARFEVTFLFNGQPAYDVLPINTTADAPNVTLQYETIKGKFGQSLSCSVVSFWTATPEKRSRALTTNEYFMGVRASSQIFEVVENNPVPQTLMLWLTLPVVCLNEYFASLPDPCEFQLLVETTGDIAVRQRLPGEDPLARSLRYTFRESDWKNDEKLAYNTETPLEIVAKTDAIMTPVRQCRIAFRVAQDVIGLPQGPQPLAEMALFEEYSSLISDILLNATVYRRDDTALYTCKVLADPHIWSFDRIWYDSHIEGTFIYATTTVAGYQIEVQLKQQICPQTFGWLPWVTCICGAALRENTQYVYVDFCGDSLVPARCVIKSMSNKIQDDKMSVCRILTDNSAQIFMLVGPSGTYVHINMYGSLVDGYFMNVEINIPRMYKVEGLCGTADDNNDNEIKKRNEEVYTPSANWPWFTQIPADFAESWRPPPTKNLFDGYVADQSTLSLTDVKNPLTFCHYFNESVQICSGEAITDFTILFDANNPVTNCTPLPHSVTGLRRKRRAFIKYGRVARATSMTDSSGSALNNITEVEANATCWNLMVNDRNLGPDSTDNILANLEATNNIVGACAADLRMTGSTEWAYDKVATLQRALVVEAVTRNRSDSTDVESAIKSVYEDVQRIENYICSPFDCNGHGQCIDGSCQCDEEYFGVGCSVRKGAVPVLVDSVLPNCDLRRENCVSISMWTKDAAILSTSTCRIKVIKSDGSSQTFLSPTSFITTSLVACYLPSTDEVNLNSYARNFTSLFEPGFDFECLYPGSPVITYSISISNDGRNFSEEKSVSVFDSLCMDCRSTDCIQKPNTCLINGYCFNESDSNPYLPNCGSCDPSKSTTAWTVASDASLESCVGQPVCSPGLCCNSFPNFTVVCGAIGNSCKKPVTTARPVPITTASPVTKAAVPTTTAPLPCKVGSTRQASNCQIIRCVACKGSQCPGGAREETVYQCTSIQTCSKNVCVPSQKFRNDCLKVFQQYKRLSAKKKKNCNINSSVLSKACETVKARANCISNGVKN